MYFLFLFWRGGEKEKEVERNISVWLPLACPLLGTWHATQAAQCPDWEPNPATLQFTGWHSLHWATPARPAFFYLLKTSRFFCCFINFVLLKIYFYIYFYERALYCFFVLFCSTANSMLATLKESHLLYYICLKRIDYIFRVVIKLKTGTILGEKMLFYLTFWTIIFSPFTSINIKFILIKGALLGLVFPSAQVTCWPFTWFPHSKTFL